LVAIAAHASAHAEQAASVLGFVRNRGDIEATLELTAAWRGFDLESALPNAGRTAASGSSG
jgi:hypothetical protein